MTDQLACEGGRPVGETILVFDGPAIVQDEIDEVADTVCHAYPTARPHSLSPTFSHIS